MLDSYENRIGYALAFGATVTRCINVLLGSTRAVLGPSWVTIQQTSPGFVSGKFFLFIMSNCFNIMILFRTESY